MDAELPRIGCLGVGWIGRQRMESLVRADAARIVAVADPDPHALAAAAAIAPAAERFEDGAALLELGLDGLMIASPSALHAAQSIAALRVGVAVFCQKPLARDGRETAAVLAAARAADRLLGIDLSYRHVAGAAQMREMVRSGSIGEPFAAELVFHNAYGPDKEWFYDPARSGGGCLVDLGTHMVDLALWITGSDGAEVVDACRYAEGRPVHARDRVEDYARVRLALDRDTTATITCSWKLHAGRDAVIEAVFYGTAGAVALRNLDGSFYDFVVERWTGTSRERIAGPPDVWGGRAALAWARTLASTASYDPAIESIARVASVLDRIYASPSASRGGGQATGGRSPCPTAS
jgi:predicted dehydrogenase